MTGCFLEQIVKKFTADFVSAVLFLTNTHKLKNNGSIEASFVLQ